jgi:tetrahydromethanopterin S-methyltransferase subunit G
MTDNTILEAQVKLTVDNSSINKSIADASKKLENGLKKTDGALSKQLSSQIGRDVGKLGREFEKATKALSRVFERGLKFGTAMGTGAILAFLKSGTPEALKFSDSLDKLKMAFGKVGQTLATKIKFRGATGQEWLDKLVTKIENLDTS